MNPNFLHPTTKGGQIRTLEILRRLHREHEIHYVAFENPEEPEGVARSSEYATCVHPVRHRVPAKPSVAFAGQVVGNFFSSLPLAVSRYHSRAMKQLITDLRHRDGFDSVVCDFLAVAPNFEDFHGCVLFQHNVETIIWKRHQETASLGARKALFAVQAKRMFDFEKAACENADHVVAVSEVDAQRMRDLFGTKKVSVIPTGVDVDYFAPPPSPPATADMVFVGSMDWMPNVDGILWFEREVLPLIRKHRPDCSVAVVGRTPAASVLALARKDTHLRVTGTVPDVRPYLWGATVCIVPLRVGGGTRLKIYEAMAAKVPVVSTSVGAEGLVVKSSDNIVIGDSPQEFADGCIRLLEDVELRGRLADAAWKMVSSDFSWDRAASELEQILHAHCSP